MKIFSDKLYNILKYLAMIALPALALFTQTIFAIWGLPYGEQISATIVAINALLGALIGISTIGYNRQQK